MRRSTPLLVKTYSIAFLVFVYVFQGVVGMAQTRNVSLGEQENDNVMQASFVEEDISLDGSLDEAAWEEAIAISEFKQYEPVDGAPASQPTDVYVLYGANNLYVGAMLYDDRPDAIEPSLGRRDDYNRADWFLVSIDSYYDRRTAYTFGVNAAGIQFDAIQGVDSGRRGGNAPRGMDPSWDAVWYSNARITAEGWVVELRIPYSMLRFTDDRIQTWGIHFTRRIPRLGEESEWPHVPRIQRDNLVAQFGQLAGIQNVKPRRNIQVTPYTVTRLQTEEDPDALGTGLQHRSMDVGGDLKIGLGPNVTLDATINPDFGQVEADPAELNLTAFETFFEERRPFFVEGIQIYQFEAGPGQLLYTRRIGAEVPIIGATKLSGRTSSGLSFGVLGAATGDNFNPARGYGVARASQQIGAYSSAGGIVTLFDDADAGDGHLRSLAAGADWDLRLNDNQYGIEGFFALTHRDWLRSELDAETGFAGKVWLRKRQGVWNGFLGLDVFSDRFNPNDIGQLRQNNFFAFLSRVEHEINGGRPFGPFLRGRLDGSVIQQVSYREGLDMGQSIEVGSRFTFQGFQSTRLDVEWNNPTGGYDLYETRGLLPWAQPTSLEISTDFETDERRSWQLEPGLNVAFLDDGGREIEWSLEGLMNLGSRLSLSGEVRGGWGDDVSAWSSNETFLLSGTNWHIGQESNVAEELLDADFEAFEGGDVLHALLADVEPFRPGRYYVSIFGERDTRTLDFTLRSTITFTPKLSLQLYSQLFTARGRYDRFQIQQNRDTMADFDAFPKRDEFSLSSLQSNLVVRWEYRPGSSLFLVWTHGRRAEEVLNPLAPWTGSPYSRSINDQLNNTFDIFPDNVFLIKLNYTFLY